MFTTRNTLILVGLLAAVALVAGSSLGIGATKAEGPHLAHMVYFKLKDNSPGSRAKLTAACKLFLSNHPGTVYFGTGTIAGDLAAALNDRDFDVSLHLVFVNKEAHDKYHAHPRHLKFIEENKDNWVKVRVFDSYLSPALPSSGGGTGD
jgi:Stress responsive A/B Barrel Domain